MAAESAQRLAAPQPIAFDQAIFVAVVGLVVGFVAGMAWLVQLAGRRGL